MNKKIIAVLLFTFCFFGAYGQDDGGTDGFIDYAGFREMGINSPKAEGLGKYGSFPVDLSTGVPNINIPLTSVNVGGISVPVSLSYHAGGIKVTEYPGEVGLGWSLNAGGVITRVMRGFPDEHAKGFFTQLDQINDFFTTSFDDNSKNYLLDLGRNKYDAEADVFFYNFGGKSGFFSVDGTGHFVAFPDVNLQVNYGSGLSGFVITDEDGTTYTFSYNDTEETEKLFINDEDPSSNPLNNVEDPFYGTYTSAWYLSKITNPQQDHYVTFTYEAVPNISKIGSIDASYLTHKIGYQDQSCPEGTNIGTGYSESMIKEHVRLTKIESSVAGKYRDIQINYDSVSNFPIGYRVSNIIVSRDGQTEKTIQFSYSSYDYEVNGEELLRLDSIQEEFQNGLMKPPYDFTYYSGTVAGRNTLDRDFMGYPRGSRGVNHLIGRYDADGHTIGSSRKPSLSRTKTGVLQQIQYPTGGFTSFEYKLNTATVGGQLRNIGGLRIHRIIANDGITGETLKKEYSYGPSQIPGSLSNVVQYGFDRNPAVTYQANGETCTQESGTSEATTPLLGHFIVYDHVTEIIDDGNGGKRKIAFYRYGGGGADTQYRRSVPDDESFIDGTGLEVRNTTTAYTDQSTKPSIIWMRPDLQLVPNDNGGAVYYDTLFNYKSGLYKSLWLYPSQKTETRKSWTFVPCPEPQPIDDPCTDSYELDGALQATTHYTYDADHRQLSELTRINSTGEQVTTFYEYAHEVYPDMESVFMLTQPYSVTVKDGTGTVLRKQWLEWSSTNGKWFPAEKWMMR